MSRKAKTDEVQRAVLDSAADLMQEKGYEGTTIKDISEMSGVSTGSIYHFFGSKDGIIGHLIHKMFEKAASLADQATQAESDPYLILALELTGQVQLISKSSKLAATYSAAYRSWPLTQIILSAAVRRNRKLFANALPAWGEDQFYAASSVIKGVLSALVDERVHLDRLTLTHRVESLLKAVLPVFGATEQHTQEVLANILLQLGAKDLAPELRRI